jgi:hypothetical protein
LEQQLAMTEQDFILENGFIKKKIHIFDTGSVKVYKKVVLQNGSQRGSMWP